MPSLSGSGRSRLRPSVLHSVAVGRIGRAQTVHTSQRSWPECAHINLPYIPRRQPTFLAWQKCDRDISLPQGLPLLPSPLAAALLRVRPSADQERASQLRRSRWPPDDGGCTALRCPYSSNEIQSALLCPRHQASCTRWRCARQCPYCTDRDHHQPGEGVTAVLLHLSWAAASRRPPLATRDHGQAHNCSSGAGSHPQATF